jgi:hypothetical protein
MLVAGYLAKQQGSANAGQATGAAPAQDGGILGQILGGIGGAGGAGGLGGGVLGSILGGLNRR